MAEFSEKRRQVEEVEPVVRDVEERLKVCRDLGGGHLSLSICEEGRGGVGIDV